VDNVEQHILFEDNHLLAVCKPAGLLCHGDATGDETLTDIYRKYLKIKYKKPGNVFLNPAHRIDRPVSGALMMARTSKANGRLAQAFKEKNVQKTYWAICQKKPRDIEGKMVNYLSRNQNKNKSFVTSKNEDGAKRAELNYRLLADLDNSCLLEIQLITGRHHQIRAQLAHMNCAIIGDLKYGSRVKTDGRSIGLHAKSIQLMHPVQKTQLNVIAPLPNKDFWLQYAGF